ncbi:MAG TPA: BamA/TamA family outer membrane protein [Paludibacter sp.]|nr:BamA/TamA family outer membrane protein [Paludibacter sp.]
MKFHFFGLLIFVALFFAACSSTKYVPDGEYLLDKVSIRTDNKDINKSELWDYLRQTPNAGMFGKVRMQLGVYNLAPKDTSNWMKRVLHKTFQKIGDPPVIYNPSLTVLSTQQLQQQLGNKGYINALVTNNVELKDKKAKVDYIVNARKPYRLHDYSINLRNRILYEIAADTSKSLVHPGMLFDVDVLNSERERITSRLRQLGYYNFNKDFLSYTADSLANSHQIDLVLELHNNLVQYSDSVEKVLFKKYTIRKVIFYTNTNDNLLSDIENKSQLDTVSFRDFILVTPRKRILKLDALVQNTFINPNSLYSDRAVERTYSGLNSLGPVKYVNISFKETADTLLDCYVVITPAKTLSVSTELEGTYTQGYWGAALKGNYIDRNLFKGAETLSMQGRWSFEKQDQVWAKEIGANLGLKFPHFLFPFASYDFKRNIHANTEFTSALSYQIRPLEFTSTNIGAGIKYSWNRGRYLHNVELFDLSYVTFNVDPRFNQNYLRTGLFNKYNYENHFIMRTGYSGSYTDFDPGKPLRNFSTMRYSIETAGNTLSALSRIFNSTPDSTGSYKLFNIRYSQYVKGEYNVTHHQIFNNENRFVYHLGVGVGVPYGNADIIPYERRFYSGGANSVRGWSESRLGPGVYSTPDSISIRTRDYNQVGDIKLDLNMEYRTKLFWVVEGAFFLDAGNIWTIKPYSTQPGGEFRLDSFFKQIAIAYGLGTRLDFSYFMLRFDLGLKLFNPVLPRREQWRIQPGFDDMAFHIAIGYPF